MLRFLQCFLAAWVPGRLGRDLPQVSFYPAPYMVNFEAAKLGICPGEVALVVVVFNLLRAKAFYRLLHEIHLQAG